jgi:hypothetical protein
MYVTTIDLYHICTIHVNDSYKSININDLQFRLLFR